MAFSDVLLSDNGSGAFDISLSSAAAQDISSVGGIVSAETFGTTKLLSSARPDADVTDGSWVNSDAGTELYSYIDELYPDNVDWIEASSSECEISMGSLGDPGVHTNHIVRYRISKDGADNLGLTVSLMDGATQIASWVHSSVNTDWVDVEQTLTEQEASNITNYADLRLAFEVA